MNSAREVRRIAAITLMAAFLMIGLRAPAQAQGSAVNGQAIFHNRCAVCHGAQADGRSNLARIMQPPPANLRASTLSDDEQALIVRQGGAAMGRSPNMPEWRVELTDEELTAVLIFIRSIKGTAP
jgi:mono/diheme cytochrome c family protein